MGLSYKGNRWLDKLWGEHLNISEGAQTLVRRGIAKQGTDFAGFPADIHARLYLPRDPALSEKNTEWATKLHSLASELGEWAQLRSMCARNGFAAGIAAEVMLEQLLPLVPQRPETPAQGVSPEAMLQDDSSNSDGPDDATIRAALRRASRTAKDAVQKAETGLEGMATSLGLSGSSCVRQSGRAALKSIREAHERLSKSHRLRQIAELAGRMERLAGTKARSRIRPGVGEVHGVGLGGDLSRILPSELAGFRHPVLRRLALAKLIGKRCMSYEMEGREPIGRGPIVVLLDESASMRDDGCDIWSKAVALALLATATRQKRSWQLVTFNGFIRREVSIAAGRASSKVLEGALDHDCRGGTDFAAPLLRAIEIIKTSPTMRKADVVVITDGEDSVPDDVAKEANALTRNESVSWFAIGIGKTATSSIRSLECIATSISVVRNVQHDSTDILDVINLQPKKNE